MDPNIQILAVDDDAFNLVVFNEMLTGPSGLKNITIHSATNGREAISFLEKNPDIDVIILDLHMPVLDGFETIKELKRDSLLCDIPVIVVTADKNEVLKTLTLGANDFLAKPYDPDELKLRVMNHARTKKLNDIMQQLNSLLETEVSQKTAQLQKTLQLSQRAEYEISLRLGKAAEYRDTETGMHTVRISHFSLKLAQLAGLSEEQCKLLHYASPLHDVGKIGIPDRILLKPDKLNEHEFQIMQKHTTIGGKILKGDDFPIIRAGRIVAEQHHEKWDGTGYPNGLKGHDIHIFGRIVMIVDVFDALTSDRPYKPAYSLEKTMMMMRTGREHFFDPDLLDIFLANIDSFTEIRSSFSDINDNSLNPFDELLNY